MKIKQIVMLAAIAMMAMLSSCRDSESYTEKLNDERKATNAYLAQFRVEDHIPSDTVFETGSDAPFYKLDEDGNVYMQVIKAGDRKNNKARTSQTIYFRYTRYDLLYWHTSGGTMNSEGNETEMSLSSTYFLYNDFTLPASSQWGYGIQMPLLYLGIDSEVNLVIKSQYGLSDEISYVNPFMYHVRYFKSGL